jgi:flavin reductase (DIM6/NTAB) family NADH-FMN oxidoreductase RutF
MTSHASDPAALRHAFGRFPSGVTALCAIVDGRTVGMAASAFTAVSLQPPLVAVCLQRTSRTWQELRRAAHVGISVLGAGHDAQCRSLAGPADARFLGGSWSRTGSGAVLLRDAEAQFDCSLEQEIDAGDHTIALLRVHATAVGQATDPLVFHASTFRRLAPAPG